MTRRTIQQLKQEIDALNEIQREAMRHATYLGMNAEDAKKFEARRLQITALVNEMYRLQQPGDEGESTGILPLSAPIEP